MESAFLNLTLVQLAPIFIPGIVFIISLCGLLFSNNITQNLYLFLKNILKYKLEYIISHNINELKYTYEAMPLTCRSFSIRKTTKNLEMYLLNQEQVTPPTPKLKCRIACKHFDRGHKCLFLWGSPSWGIPWFPRRRSSTKYGFQKEATPVRAKSLNLHIWSDQFLLSPCYFF